MKKKLFLLSLLGWLAIIFIFIAIGGILFILLKRSLPVLGLELFFGDTAPMQAIFSLIPVWSGIWPACVGTLYLVFLTVALALLPGIGCGIFITQYASAKQSRILLCAIDILAGVPSIVMGLFGFTLIIFLRKFFLPNANTCLLLAAICLALLVLPSLILTTCEAITSLPKDLLLTGAALGFNHEQRIRYIILPAASSGIMSGIMMAFGRAAEDTAVIMLTGVVANSGAFTGIFGKFQALPFYIYYTAAQYQNQNELAQGFGAALVLLILAAGILLATQAIEKSFKNRWKRG